MKGRKATRYEKKETVKQDWYVVDLTNKTLGRAATKIATYLRGKHKTTFTPHVDCGDFIVVINADKFRVTGKKMDQKIYFRHSDYPGGAKYVPLKKMDPVKVEQQAVKGMLPKNRLGRQMFTKLKVYVGTNHPHEAQKPKDLEV